MNQVTDSKMLLSRMNQRERQLLVHSYIYYELNDSIIPDDKWSRWAAELAELRDAHPDIFKQSAYAEAFADFDPSTGYNLYRWYMRSEIVNKALYLLKMQ